MSQPAENPEREAALVQAALAWHAATTRGDCDWDAFTAWLERDPAHQRAYADVALIEDRVAHHAAALRAAPPVERIVAPTASRRSWPWLAAAMAAGVVGVALVLTWNPLPLSTRAAREYQAQASAQTVALDDGTRILLAPGSHMVISGGRRQDHVELRGAAYFDVPHDPSRRLVIRAGGYEVHDIGTRFEVFGAGRELKVAVAEGDVTVGLPGGRGARVSGGQQLIVAGEPAVAEYASIASEDVAGWQSGRLVFRNEPLSLVAGQVGPHAGVTIAVDPAIAGRRFSGVLAIGDGSQLVARLGEIMGLAVQSQGGTVRLSSGDPRR